MSNLEKHAILELDRLGLIDDGGIDGAMRKAVLHIIKEFAKEGHSGFSADYCIGLLEKLLRYEPLTPLTGDDGEWVDVAEQSGYTLYQNKRCGHVFKDNSGPYDINGIVFWDWEKNEDGVPYKSYFTSKDSRVHVTFPYVPTTQYMERSEFNQSEKSEVAF